MAPTVRLEPLHPGHLDHVMTWVNDHEILSYFANRQSDITREEEAKYIQGLVASRNDRAFSVFDSETGEYIGQCSINAIYWPARNGRVFLVITREKQGRGYARVILQRLQEVARELGLHKLWLIVRADNVEAQAKYLKVGFRFEGLLRDEYCVGGVFYDMIRMGWLA